MEIIDYLVVGSGCSGAIAARTLVEAGRQVTMIDVGIMPSSDIQIPDKDFLDIRKTEDDQYSYLIGNSAGGVKWGKVGKGEQITPPREYITSLTDKYLKIVSDSFHSVESLAYGGLGVGWGLQSWRYTDSDLRRIGLDPKDMDKAYNQVSKWIGISGEKDAASKYTLGSLRTFQPALRMDRNHQYILSKYKSEEEYFKKRGILLGRTPLALISKNYEDRKQYAYHDMDFYSDNDQSAWRPWIMVNRLRSQANFSYISGYLLLRFEEDKAGTKVFFLDIKTSKEKVFHCRKLILATGSLGTARVVLRSLGKEGSRLPILCNPYTYVPCIQPRFIGKEAETKKLGFSQLSMFLDSDKAGSSPESVAYLYGYQSLMLFRIIRQIPLNFRDSSILMRYLMSGLIILSIQHADSSSPSKYLNLQHDANSPTGDNLHVSYALSSKEISEQRHRERKVIKAMRKMGTYGVKRFEPGAGSSIHYAGTLPYSGKEHEFTLANNGRLHGTRNVFVADSSGFEYLPPSGLTFTLMANAHNVARSLLSNG